MKAIANPVTTAVAVTAATFLAPYADGAQTPATCTGYNMAEINHAAIVKFTGRVTTDKDGQPVAVLQIATGQCIVTKVQADYLYAHIGGLEGLNRNQAPATKKIFDANAVELNKASAAIMYYEQRVSEEKRAQIDEVIRNRVNAETKKELKAEAAPHNALKHSVTSDGQAGAGRLASPAQPVAASPSLGVPSTAWIGHANASSNLFALNIERIAGKVSGYTIDYGKHALVLHYTLSNGNVDAIFGNMGSKMSLADGHQIMGDFFQADHIICAGSQYPATYENLGARFSLTDKGMTIDTTMRQSPGAAEICKPNVQLAINRAIIDALKSSYNFILPRSHEILSPPVVNGEPASVGNAVPQSRPSGMAYDEVHIKRLKDKSLAPEEIEIEEGTVRILYSPNLNNLEMRGNLKLDVRQATKLTEVKQDELKLAVFKRQICDHQSVIVYDPQIIGNNLPTSAIANRSNATGFALDLVCTTSTSRRIDSALEKLQQEIKKQQDQNSKGIFIPHTAFFPHGPGG